MIGDEIKTKPMSEPEELAKQIEELKRQLQASNSDGTSLTEVVRLAREVELRSGITIDFGATPELGQPLVVAVICDSTSGVDAFSSQHRLVIRNAAIPLSANNRASFIA